MAIVSGRSPWLGIAMENTAGTAVAPVKYIPFTSCDFRRVQEHLVDDAARGIREVSWGDAAGKSRGEGSMECYVDATNFAYLIYPCLGNITNSQVSGDTAVKSHTITRKSSNPPKTVTITKYDGVDTRKYTYGTINNLELSVSDGLATAKVDLISQEPTASSATRTLTTERILAFKDYSIKFGSGATGTAAVAAAAAASATAVRSFTLRINNNAEAIYLSGSASPNQIAMAQLDIDGDFSLFYESTTNRTHYETLKDGSNDIRAMIVEFNGKTIGSSTNTEKIKITIPNFTISERTVDSPLEGFIAETLSYKAIYDSTEAKSITVYIRNLTATY